MSAPEPSPSAEKGSRYGNYILGDRLAAGGMAELFHARSVGRRYEKPIVLKRMHPHLSENREFVAMFIDEARISTRLEHPNIVQVFDFEATERGLFLIMELIDGPDVHAVLKRCSKLKSRIPEALAVYIACHALEALDYAHSATSNGRRLGVVHRDVSPSNILLTRRGHVKLADFGIARAAERQQKTATGTLKGKYGYMSPEQVLGHELDGRSDVFSMAIVLAEMLMTRRLFTAPGDLETLLMVRRGDLSRLDKYGQEIPEALQTILRTALSVDRDQRYESAGAFRDALADWLAATNQRTGAARLAELINELEAQGGSLCSWSNKSLADSSAATMSGPETVLARLEIQKAARRGKKMFALGNGTPVEPSPPDADDFGLARYEGAAQQQEQQAPPARRARTSADALALEEGELREVNPVDIYCEIGSRERTGVLVMRSGDKVKEAYFRDGHPEFVRSNVPEDRFGQYLVRRKVLTDVQLGRALAVLPHFDGRLGQALVSLDLLKPVDAARLLADQVAYKLVDSCSWRDGRYFFRHGVRNPFPGLELRLNTMAIVGQSLPWIDNARLTAWGKEHRDRKPVIDLEAARGFRFADEVYDQLATIARGETTIAAAVARVPSKPARRAFVAAAYALWRYRVLRLRRLA